MRQQVYCGVEKCIPARASDLPTVESPGGDVISRKENQSDQVLERMALQVFIFLVVPL